MVLPQTNKAPKARKAPGTFAGMTWFFEDMRMEATFRQGDKDGMRLDATAHKGRQEVLALHLDHLEDLLEGLGAAFSQPAMLALLPMLQEKLAGTVAHARPVPSHHPKPTAREHAGSEAAFKAQCETLDAWAKGHGIESWASLTHEALDKAQAAALHAADVALAEYDAAHGAAEA